MTKGQGLFSGDRSGTLRPVTGRKPTLAGYREDPLYPRIVRAVEGLLDHGNVVTPVETLIGMDLLSRKDLEDWRRGRVPYLERVIDCNLTRLGRLLRILRFHAHDLNLKPSWTAYMRWGKGPTQRLKFTKTGDTGVEDAYATHFVWPGKGDGGEVRLRPTRRPTGHGSTDLENPGRRQPLRGTPWK